MKQDLWQRIEQLFDELATGTPAEREEVLGNLDDGWLEAELRSLLSSHDSRGRFDELAEQVAGLEVQHILRLAPGHRLGHYEIVREIGRGGMATVYLARDLRHERQVAVKVLAPALAAVIGTDRFHREIMTTAKLQHPHILPLLDSGQTDGLVYYVMPFIEGETLRERLNREHQLGVEEALEITTGVADALAHAHRHGVVHRDIKPENILLQEGRPLVTDFGIAMAVSAGGVGRTDTGFVLGTPHYMSPEQATAPREVTWRSDIYSLGCVLYEMLAGSPPNTGTSSEQIVEQILSDEIRPIAELRKSVPPNVAAATAVSLEKLPADRFTNAAAFAEALRDPTFRGLTVRVPPTISRSRDRWRRLAVGLGALATITTIAVLAVLWSGLREGGRGANAPTVEFLVDPPYETRSPGNVIALSPDGSRLVAQALTEGGSLLYERRVSSIDWRIIPGTEGASVPFFSPDGRWLGFFTSSERALKRIPLAGGPAQTIAQASWIGGASWGSDHTIVFSTREDPSTASPPGLFRVSADGGIPERLPIPDTILDEGLVTDPCYSTSGDVVFFKAGLASPSVMALSLETGAVARLAAGMTPTSDRPDRVIYVTPEGSIVAGQFDPGAMKLEGSPKPLAEGVILERGVHAPYSISSNGSLAYVASSGRESRLLLVSRSGQTRPLYSAPPGSTVGTPRFSPSGSQVAFVRDGDIWVYSVHEGTARRLSFERPYAADPTWTTDGRSVAYSVAAGGGRRFASLFLRSADGTGSAEEILVGESDLWEAEFVPGVPEVVFFSVDNVYRASLGSGARPVPLLETESFVAHASLSPDGRWIAYRSNESGTDEVYVRSYPDMGPPTIVSVGGGRAPLWSADGTEIFYWGRGYMNVASVRPDGSRIAVEGHQELFPAAPFEQEWGRGYDVHPSDGSFVVVGRPDTRIVWRTNALGNRP